VITAAIAVEFSERLPEVLELERIDGEVQGEDDEDRPDVDESAPGM
jgi:hypothetical protein